MRFILASSLLIALSLAAAAGAFADTVILNDGTIRRGEILEVLEDGIRVRFTPKGGGTAEMRVNARRLDAHFFYALRADAVGDDAKARLKLAMWAFEAGLFSRARIQVEEASRLDPELVKDIREGRLPEIRDGIADRVLASAKADIDAGRDAVAQRKLEILLARLPDTEAGTAAVEVYQALRDEMRGREAREAQERKEAELEQAAEEERKAAEERHRLLAPAERDLRRANDELSAGLTEDNEARALNRLGSAVSRGQSAVRRLDRLARDRAGDAKLMAEVEAQRKQATDLLVRAHLMRAEVEAWRGSTSRSRREIEAARKLDPDNPRITATEEAIANREDSDALELQWTRSRRQGHRFRGGGPAGGGGRR